MRSQFILLHLAVDVLRQKIMPSSSSELLFYLDIIQESGGVISHPPLSNTLSNTICIQPHTIPRSMGIIIFVKHFDTKNQSLLGHQRLIVSSTSRISDIVPIINTSLGLTLSTPLRLYEVRKFYLFTTMQS